ncbi:DUF4355 domain-containing protein [Clostridium ljungdahlii]|uniref:Phage minor structural protein GP20 n=2 Tax=Clostridium ljungdahlii TaxID=1538 RepID=D8GU72_CLOLD|nr:DUF4355 domain-containing protein [Clostridium ljungdahlii]ADK14735.1 conserved hypothetical protein [Clostridium ljungdahlii DSM 13528]OAA84091.1 hypothetical protein WX45_01935 [Clostridium ljungdahlii DSM 13528]
MDFKELGLSDEQSAKITEYVTGEVSKAKEGFKDYVSQEDLNKSIQSETDKVRTEYSKKLKDATDELNKYKPVEKSDGEIEMEKRLKVLEDKEKEVAQKEKVMNISNKLEERGLPKQLSKYLVGAEDLETSMAEIKELFNNAQIQNGFKPDSHKSKEDSITKEQFQKMGLMDRMNLFKTNQELYEKLSK